MSDTFNDVLNIMKSTFKKEGSVIVTRPNPNYSQPGYLLKEDKQNAARLKPAKQFQPVLGLYL